jgi:ABC-2 type transport system permease protein
MSLQADLPARRRARPFYWSVRRELWENRAVYLAPLAVQAVVMLAFLFSLLHLPRAVLAAKTGQALNMPYAAAAGALFVTSFFVAIFYCLSALHGERRDRSLLFWKSLPVSDLVTVLSKAAIPLLVQPVIILVLAVAVQLTMLALSTLVLLANGMNPALLWRHLHLPLMWAVLPYGLALNILWDVPVYAYLIMVSAWAKRMTFVWAVVPPLALCLFEFLAFRTRHLLEVLNHRVFGGYELAFTVGGKGKVPISSLADVDPVGFLANPGVWTGLAFGAACLAACVWLRRRADPI